MTTVQVLFEQYKVLPPPIRQELKKLIEQDEPAAGVAPAPNEEGEDNDDDDDSGDTIRISLEALHTSIEQVKLLKAGKAELISVEELFACLDDDESED